MFTITVNRNIQCYKTTNVKANIFTTNIIWIVFFPSVYLWSLGAKKTVCREVSQSDGLCLFFFACLRMKHFSFNHHFARF